MRFACPGAAASPALGAPRAHWAALPPGAVASHRARGTRPWRALHAPVPGGGALPSAPRRIGAGDSHRGRKPTIGVGKLSTPMTPCLPQMRTRARPGPLGCTRNSRRTRFGGPPRTRFPRLCGRPSPRSRVAWFAGAETGPPSASAVWGSCADAEIPLPLGSVLVRVLEPALCPWRSACPRLGVGLPFPDRVRPRCSTRLSHHLVRICTT